MRSLTLKSLISVAIALAFAASAFGAALAVVDAGTIGWLNDDAMYANYARALHEGLGYTNTAVPGGEPAQRYPIGFPALLALVLVGATDALDVTVRMQLVGPVAAGLMVLAATYYVWRNWRIAFPLAALVAGLIGIHPKVVDLAAIVSSDVPFAALSLAVLALIEARLRSEDRRWPWWATAGVLIGGCFLFRYAGIALMAALVTTLAWRRSWWALGAMSGGFAAVALPWLTYRMVVGGGDYQHWIGATAEKDPALLFEAFRLITGTLFASVLPSLLVPPIYGLSHLATLLAGLAIGALMLLGALAALWRPAEGQTPLGPVYLLISVGMVLIWMVSDALNAMQDTLRLLLPVAPLAVAAFLRGAVEVRERLGIRPEVWQGRAAVAAFSLSFLWMASSHLGYHAAPGRIAAAFARQSTKMSVYDYVRREVPRDAVILSMNAPGIHYHTGRYAYGFGTGVSRQGMLNLLMTTKADHLVGLPFLAEPPPNLDRSTLPAHMRHAIDVSVLVINDLNEHCPGLLELRFVAPSGNGAVFRVDRSLLARYAGAPQQP